MTRPVAMCHLSMYGINVHLGLASIMGRIFVRFPLTSIRLEHCHCSEPCNGLNYSKAHQCVGKS